MSSSRPHEQLGMRSEHGHRYVGQHGDEFMPVSLSRGDGAGARAGALRSPGATRHHALLARPLAAPCMHLLSAPPLRPCRPSSAPPQSRSCGSTRTTSTLIRRSWWAHGRAGPRGARACAHCASQMHTAQACSDLQKWHMRAALEWSRLTLATPCPARLQECFPTFVAP